ncbi:hypothetical protein HDU87_001877 [Geranomyces variabilis]|uniref:Uncharacterized protein n=1 Tax=Geranomyces variabilis TaxID=109894 RepID=A0AAD5TPJ3_9FUNG|nr:hypothetical protein HDU87_001877 [Geranomyces variabilis]
MPKTITNKRLLFIIATLLVPAVSVSSAPLKIDPTFSRFHGSSPSLATPSPSVATPSSAAASSSSLINLLTPPSATTSGGSSNVLHQRQAGPGLLQLLPLSRPDGARPRQPERRMSMPAVSVVAVSGSNPLLRRDGDPETVVVISGDADESYADTTEGGMVVVDGR